MPYFQWVLLHCTYKNKPSLYCTVWSFIERRANSDRCRKSQSTVQQADLLAISENRVTGTAGNVSHVWKAATCKCVCKTRPGWLLAVYIFGLQTQLELELLTSQQTADCDLRPKAKTHRTVELGLTMLCSSNHGNRAEHSPEVVWR